MTDDLLRSGASVDKIILLPFRKHRPEAFNDNPEPRGNRGAPGQLPGASSQMRVIAVASMKGGSGKTTMAAHLAVRAAAAGERPVALIDTDPQGSLGEWWDARTADT